MSDSRLWFQRLSGFLMFIVLQIVCFVLIVKYNKKQQAIFVHSAQLYSGIMNEQVGGLMQFWYMSEYADSLASENARLMAKVGNSKYEDGYIKMVDTTYMDTTRTHYDSIRTIDLEQQFSYIGARVVNNSIVQQYNYLTINRGSKHGIKKDMGVWTHGGVVGIVVDVTPHFARVMSVLNEQSNISVTVKKNNYFGTLTWRNRNPALLALEGIPKHANLKLGDTLVTSGYSEVFPPGLFAGKVARVSVEQGSNFYTCYITPSVDLAKISHVYVIDNLLIGELRYLNNKTQNE